MCEREGQLNFLAHISISRFTFRHMKKQKAYAAAGVDIYFCATTGSSPC
jgi:hypothetical protein